MSSALTRCRGAGADRQRGGQPHGGEGGPWLDGASRGGGGWSSLDSLALGEHRGHADTGTYQVAQRRGCGDRKQL